MGIYVACQCGQAFSAIADAGRTRHNQATPAPRKLPLVLGQGAFARATALVAAAALVAWLAWGQLGGSRGVAGQPPVEGSNRRGETSDLGTSAVAGSPGAAGQTHRSDDDAIEFWLPAGAKSETRRSLGTSAGLADRTRVTWGNRKTGQLVGTIYLFRGRHDDLAADTQMKVETLKGLYKTYGSRVSQIYRDITHREFTGVEAVIQVSGERDNTFRFLYTGDYLVTLEAVGPPGLATSARAQKFFNSLRMVRSPKRDDGD